jgi:hypothetical protein
MSCAKKYPTIRRKCDDESLKSLSVMKTTTDSSLAHINDLMITLERERKNEFREPNALSDLSS